MYADDAPRALGLEIGEAHVVRRDRPDRARIAQMQRQGFRADLTLARVRAVHHLVEQEQDGGAAVDDIVAYSEKARDAATQTKKRLKNVEIDIRKMAEKLRDIKRTLAFDDQPPVELAIRRLEDVRTTLLKEMFAKENKKEKK